ncbi:MAG: PAS domain S-box protein, partial [Desulfobacteraceae bacterium]
AFFAIGAYTMALLNSPFPHNLMWGFWPAVVLGVVLAALAGVLLGLRAALLMLGLNAAILIGLGWLVAAGHFETSGALFQTFERALAAGASFFFLNAGTALSVAVLVEGLESTSRQKELTARKLDEERAGLISAKASLRAEVEERKASEAALRESEGRYKLLAENVSDVIWTVDIGLRFTYLSPSADKLLGYTADELLRQPVTDLLAPDSQRLVTEKVARMVARLAQGGNRPFDLQNLEIQMIRKDGAKFWTEIQNSFFLNERGEVAGIIGVARDITKRKQAEKEKERLETQLLQAEKMKAIGTLAGGVAHDLNNILSGIVSYPELLLLDLSANHPMAAPLKTIQESGKKAAAIVQDLLTLARRGVSASDVVNLNDVVTGYLISPEHKKLLQFHPSVEIERRLDASLLNILGSPHHLSKTLMNLVSNAAEAMPEGGKITIATANRYVDRPLNGYDRIDAGDYCVLTVADTGTGIAPEELPKIFEPFYTKKVMGRSGTGLGMAVVWGTVKDHNGYIEVKSALQQGSVFTLYFPVTRRVKTMSETAVSMEDYRGHGETVLVVDDVRDQREIATKMLAKLGYRVNAVESGEEAILFIASQPADLVILDM